MLQLNHRGALASFAAYGDCVRVFSFQRPHLHAAYDASALEVNQYVRIAAEATCSDSNPGSLLVEGLA